MGDISVMARRLSDGSVQYGWSGNGGYYQNTGMRLISWYNDPEKVDYLFGLGQTGRIGRPGSEDENEEWYFTHDLTGYPFWQGTSERQIFSKIAFVDYGYFYDTDNKWYYVVPGPFRIKIPLEFITEYLNENDCDFEFDFIDQIRFRVIIYIFKVYYNEDSEFRDFLAENFDVSVQDIFFTLLLDNYPISCLYDKYNQIYRYFDDWVVVGREEGKYTFKVKKKEEKHIETIEW